MVCSAFHYSILEEYYTGGLFLGLFNGVTDGSVLMIGLNLYMGFFGTQIFADMHEFTVADQTFKYTGGQLVIIILGASLVGEIALKYFSIFLKNPFSFVSIIKFQKTKRPNSEFSEAPFTWLGLATNFFALPIFASLLFYSCAFAPDPILKTQPLLPMLLYIFTFVQNTLYIQTAHVTWSVYSPWNNIYCINLAGIAGHCFLLAFTK